MITRDRVGIFTPSTGINSAEECLDFIKTHGGLIQAWTIEPTLAHEMKPGLARHDILKEVEKGELRVSSLSGYMDWTIEERNRDRREEFKRLINDCENFGCNIVCTETGRNFTDCVNDKKAWSLLVDSMKELACEAESKSVYIAIEMGRSDIVYGVESFRRLQNDVGSDVLKINFDPANLITGGLSPVSVLQDLKNDVVQMHLKDACSLPKMMPLTKGEADFIKLVDILESNGFTGNYIIEQEYTKENAKEAVDDDYKNIIALII